MAVKSYKNAEDVKYKGFHEQQRTIRFTGCLNGE